MKSILLILFVSSYNLTAQTENVKWDKKLVSYSIQSNHDVRDYSLQAESISQLVVKSFALLYWFFISDLDGDNCPFRPSCSRFLIDAVKETNLPQGILMFFDRFTRDTNIFNRENKYPHYGDSHFYDPVTLYTLDEEKIKYLPPHTRVQGE